MFENTTFPTLLRRLWHHVSIARKRQLGVMLILLTLSSVAEVVSIGAVLPFLGVLTQPQHLSETKEIQWLMNSFGVGMPEQLALSITLSFALLTVVAGSLRLITLNRSIRLAFDVGADLSNEAFVRTLNQPYSVHIGRNSSEVVNGISTKTNEVIFYVVMPMLALINALVILFAILVILLFIIPDVAFWAFGTFGLIYGCISVGIRKGRVQDSKIIAIESNHIIQLLQESFGGIRDILIDGSQSTFAAQFRRSDSNLRHAQGNNQFISQSPRYVMEALGIVTIAALAYLLTLREGGLAASIPTMAALTLGLQRMLPMAQQAYHSWSTMNGAQGALQDTLRLLEQPLASATPAQGRQVMPFEREIAFKNYSFRYAENAPWVLRDINFNIPKGARIGLRGETGSGKSTLVDVIMGLLVSPEGAMSIDSEVVGPLNVHAWQAHIAHVPQDVFLTDSSVASNIAFGLSEDQIDIDRVRRAAYQAKIGELIESWPDQFNTFVGERGVQLSGGQRQRIGIARAMYKQADVIIFDEATSALDTTTEAAVMQSIEALDADLTVIIIAHRLSTLKRCDFIYRVDGGSIILEDREKILSAI